MPKHKGWVKNCDCWKCAEDAAKQKLTCTICGEQNNFSAKKFYRRFRDIPFGKLCGCCNLHNHQPRCKICGKRYLKKRFSALAQIKLVMEYLGVSKKRLTHDTYIRSVTLDVSRLSADTKHTLIDTLGSSFTNGTDRPDLYVKTGKGQRKL
jgi:hypothetical protein